MEWVEKLNKAIGYIEEHLRGELNYNEVIKICCCSLPKFQQMFSITCGVPVSEYIRNRRMTVAAHELINTDIKIIDLALMLGYDSPESFTRAYQLFHGVSPSTTRKTKSYEEYYRASIQIQVYGGKFKMGTKPTMRIETERLIIRKFQPDDWKDLQEISMSNANSEFGDCDEQWPTDENGIKSACNYIATEHQFWAVEVKEINKVVCFINFNGINQNQNLNIGHIINANYLGNNYEYEALKALYNYGFLELGVLKISATWTLADNEKLAPLKKLGMKIVKTFMTNKFRPNSDGTTSQFEACSLLVTREEWITNPVV